MYRTLTRLRSPFEPSLTDVGAFLDRTAQELASRNNVANAMDHLSDGLWWLRRLSIPQQWSEVVAQVSAHPLLQMVHEDPFTHRSFSKPRGYAGDAVLVDLMYYDRGFADLASVSELGRAIFERNKNTPAPASVRARRDLMAEHIDAVCAEKANAAILAVACGHLREASASESIARQQFGRFVALDQDAESLAIVKDQYAKQGVEIDQRKIRALFAGAYKPRSFDLIYAAGLYDYLDDRVATRLTTVLFELLKPGGRLVLGNFVPDIYDVGYMEACMGWFLIYRNLGQLELLANEIARGEISLKRLFTLPHSDVGYLELRRRSGSSWT